VEEEFLEIYRMKFLTAIFVLCLLGFAAFAAADNSDFCTAQGTSGTPTVVVPDSPVRILYVIISMNDGGWTYNNDMLLGYKLLVAAVASLNNTSSVDLWWLFQGHPLTADLSVYTQIWVVDLCAQEDKEADKMAAYTKIANWWQSKGQPHIICDGRWISSLWTYDGTVGGSSRIFNFPVNAGRPNGMLVLNYFFNLHIRAGGLFLGTDHYSFVSGINEINRLIGLDPFTDIYYEFPYLLEVDDQSGILTWPLDPTHHWQKDGHGKTTKYLWDDSSTGFAPYNQQPNGLILYPLGWHGSAGSGKPGISCTIRGTKGFLINIQTPQCDQAFVAGNAITFTAVVVTDGTAPYTWTWTSDVDGTIGSAISFSASLSVGIHQIVVRAVDKQKLAAEAKVRISVGVNSGNNQVCYLVRYNQDPTVHEIFPIKRNMTDVNYYGLDSKGNSNTPDKLEEANNGQFFFYSDGTTSSVFTMFGSSGKANPRNDKGSFGLKVSGSAVATSKLVVKDTNSDTAFDIQGSVLSGSFGIAKSTAGFVLSGLPTNSFYCLRYHFSSFADVQQWVIRSHTTDSTTVPNTSPIIAWRSKAGSVPDLELCRAQCRCAAQSTLTSLAGSFTNSIVLDSFTGEAANYFPGTSCSWLIQPQSPTNSDIWGTVLYFSSMSLGTGDSVNVYAGTDAKGTLLGSFTGNSVPAPIRVDSNSPIFVQFTADNDASTGKGFSANYAVIPQLVSVTPNNGASKAKTPVTVAGANFYNSPALVCKFDQTVVNAKYVDSQHITCVAPVHNVGTYEFEVSNDGLAFTWTYGASPHGVVGFTWRGYKCT